MARKKRDQKDVAADGFGGSFGDLLRAKGLAPAGSPAPPPPDPVREEAPAPTLSDCRRVIVRISKRGRGGKTVTLVEQLPAELRAGTAKALRRALGCGATVEQEVVMVQGDQRDRVATWLTAQGVREVRRG